IGSEFHLIGTHWRVGQRLETKRFLRPKAATRGPIIRAVSPSTLGQMKQVRFGLRLAALMVALVAPISRAQSHNLVLTQPYAPGGGVVTAFGYYMSPYTATVDGTAYRVNCVDFFHDVFLGD